MKSDSAEVEKLLAKLDLLRLGNQKIAEINCYWVERCAELERENRRLRKRLQKL